MDQNSMHYVQPITIDRTIWLQKAEHYLAQVQKNKKKTKSCNIMYENRQFKKIMNKLEAENDVDTLIKAAEAFRICEKWIDASEAYAKSAWISIHVLKSLEVGATLYIEAASCLENIEICRGESYFKRAISVYCDCELYDQAGRLHLWIARNHEQKHNHEKAMESYFLACKYYQVQRHDTHTFACQQKCAYLLGVMKKYKASSIVYSEMASFQRGNNLMKYSSSESVFRSNLLLLVSGVDPEVMRKELAKSSKNDIRFEGSAYHDFLYNMITIIERKSIHDFADHVYDFNMNFEMDDWTLQIMMEIKNMIATKVEGEDPIKVDK